MSDFYSKMKSTQDNTSITENGAVGYKTTRHALADFNFKVASYRSDMAKGVKDFKDVLNEGEEFVLKYLFYLRDAREGIGERDLFRATLIEFVKANFENKDEIIDLIIKETPEYGRFDDLLSLMGTAYEGKVVDFFKAQLKQDFENYKANKSISLLAKWLPSENASNSETVHLARKLIKAFGTTPRDYRKTLSALRAYLDVVEVKTCSKDWEGIDYNTVPSKANIKYADAFLRNDETRRRQYLSDLNRGVDKDGNVVKINATVNTPHDVLHMYASTDRWGYRMSLKSYDETIEQLWKNLKQVPGLKDTIVVRDDSGSMTSTIGNTNISAYEVATALGIYCAEHNSEAYRNKIITFSETPRYLDFSDEKHFGSLHSKYEFLLKHSEVANTNVEAVFDLILATAVENKLDASELPAQILIISDMEFDSCCYAGNNRGSYWYGHRDNGVNVSLFSNIANKYAQYGYKLPKLVFWNVNSRTGTIPCIQNEAGVILVSGFSQNVLSLVNSGKTDPYDALIDELGKERYANIPLIKFSKPGQPESVKTTHKNSNKQTKKSDTPEFLM